MSSKVRTLCRVLFSYSSALACVLVAFKTLADDQIRTENVQFQDLNLSTPVGVEALRSRIHFAAKRVCSQPAQWQRTSAAACARDAEAKALETLGLPTLTRTAKRVGVSVQEPRRRTSAVLQPPHNEEELP
jgi:UrcA family protein